MKLITKFNNSTVKIISINALIIIGTWLLLQIPVFGNINNLVLDQLQGQNAPRPEIVVVKIDDSSLQKIGSWPWDRSIFAKALRNIDVQKPSVVGIDVLFFEARAGDDEFNDFINNTKTPIVLGSKIIDTSILKSIYPNANSGFVNFEQDFDGKIRQSQTSFHDSVNNCELSLSLEVVSHYLKINSNDQLCNKTIKLRNDTYATDNNQILFTYSKSNYTSISFSDVLDNKIDANFFKDKIVLIGSTTLDLRSNLNDNFEDVFGQNIAGIDIHANIINSYLNRTFLTQVNPVAILITFLLLTSLLVVIYKRIQGAVSDFILLLFLLLVTNLFGIFIFEFNLLWSFVFANLALIVNYIFIVLYKFITQKKEAQFIKKAFEQYMNPKLLSQLINNPHILKLGGETKHMTVLFSDIRGFTTISEGLKPEELVQMINNYLDFMSKVIINNEGTIDKYIGDAIMALWNAPLDDRQHEIHAVTAAIEMIDSLNEFKRKFPQYPEINIGIGLNSGEMVVGNVGGEKRFDYTVLGDNVNLGARLEGLTKKYGVPIIITENVMNGAKKEESSSKFIFRFLDEVKVKGKETAVKIYEPMKVTEENKNIKSMYEKAFALYAKGQFDEAIKIFQTIREQDHASDKMIIRILELQLNPPTDWHGVWKWDEK